MVKPYALLFGFGFLLAGCPLLYAADVKGAVPITIIVTDSAGAAIPNSQIKLWPQPAEIAKNPETNESGEVKLNVPPGNYDLFVTSPDFTPWTKAIRVEANANRTFRIVLQVASATTIIKLCSPCPEIQTGGPPERQVVPSFSITIAVTDATGSPVPYAQIGIDPKEDSWKFHEADELGKFSLKLSPGTYELAVTSPGFRRSTQRIVIKEKENQTVQAVLEPGGCLPGPCNTVDSIH
jgi:hypothetical protein